MYDARYVKLTIHFEGGRWAWKPDWEADRLYLPLCPHSSWLYGIKAYWLCFEFEWMRTYSYDKKPVEKEATA